MSKRQRHRNVTNGANFCKLEHTSGRDPTRHFKWAVAVFVLLAIPYHLFQHFWPWTTRHSGKESGAVLFKPESHDRLQRFQECAIGNLLETGLPFLEKVSPILPADYEERRGRLAEALVAEGADAFVVEPGYTFKYYGNVSQPEWEVWEVSGSVETLWMGEVTN